MSIKWIKLNVDMFSDEKIKLIEKMPEGDTLLIIWVKLLTQAGKANAKGYLMLNENIPYTDEMLSTVFDRPLPVVRMALQTFIAFGMIEIDENNFMSITNWEKHQNIEGMEKVREQTRLRTERYRERRKLLQVAGSDATVTSRDAVDIEVDIDKEIDKERDKRVSKASRPKQVYDDESPYMKMVDYLIERIQSWMPDFTFKGSRQTWAGDFRKLVEIDKATRQDIAAVMDYLPTDTFWRKNVLSAKKFREQFLRLKAEMISKEERANARSGRTYGANPSKSGASPFDGFKAKAKPIEPIREGIFEDELL